MKPEEKFSKEKQEIRKITRRKPRGLVYFGIFLALILSVSLFIFYKNYLIALISFFSVIIVFSLFNYFRIKFKETGRIKKIEEAFPDFLQLMSSNLRAGMTIDKAMLLSARPEFFPLDKEIQKAGKDITTGKNIESSLLEMSKRICSEKIHKTILLILSGIKSGGNLAVLLEDTAVNMRERDFVEKRAASNVLMYAIFIFIAVAVGAPALFSLSSVLVEILSKILVEIPNVESLPVNLPFTLSKINISVEFIKYFALIFMITIDILASLVLGLVMKGEEKEGLKYLPPMVAISVSVFFAARFFLMRFMSGLF